MKNTLKFFGILLMSLVLVTSCGKDEEDKGLEEKKLDDKNKWVLETFDSQSDSYWGQYVKIAHDSKGGVHIAYVSNDNNIYELRYAYRDSSGTWSKKTLVSFLYDNHVDIAVDLYDNIYIIYEDGQDKCLHILEKTLKGQFEDVKLDVLIDNTGYSRSYQARYGNLFADKNNCIHIAFERANYGIRYYPYSYHTTLDTTKLEVIDDNITNGNPDIVANTNGDIHIISPGSYKLNYSTRLFSSETWITKDQVLTTGDVQGFQPIGLAIDKLNTMHSVCLTTDDYLGYSPVVESDNWISTTISDGSIAIRRGNLSVATDTLSQPHILYDRGGVLSIATKGLSWNLESVGNDEVFRAKKSDLVIDSENTSHIVFYDADTKEFKYATKVLE